MMYEIYCVHDHAESLACWDVPVKGQLSNLAQPNYNDATVEVPVHGFTAITAQAQAMTTSC